MGLLDKLWDDTVAGPQPENGLSKLRKYSSFSYRPSSGKGPPDSSLGARSDGSDRELGRSYSSDLSVEPVKVTRSIMIVRPAGSPSAGNGSPPVSPASSPAGSTPPVSPFFGYLFPIFR
ncbi:dormancy-associated protein 3 [Cinnamomum micranthum f. kanehirae]|uniref:Dormancy-associated protein 3 n=1 Tax=Cinnamomum micranthum f. kanehirae TaxID=337451 RepID=A0A443PV41_9MAGN|nr:dormancy-associated protein 3 [Cinnamomum micranthum f. kanehirae]